MEVDRAALRHMGVQQILEVPSIPSPDGRGVHYDPDALVAAVATAVATHRQRQQAAQQAARLHANRRATLARRNSS